MNGCCNKTYSKRSCNLTSQALSEAWQRWNLPVLMAYDFLLLLSSEQLLMRLMANSLLCAELWLTRQQEMIELRVLDVIGMHWFRQRKPQITISSAKLSFKEEILSIIVWCYVSLNPWNRHSLMESSASFIYQIYKIQLLVNLSKRCCAPCECEQKLHLSCCCLFPSLRESGMYRRHPAHHILSDTREVTLLPRNSNSSSTGEMIDGNSSSGLG